MLKNFIVSILILSCSKQGLPQSGQLDTTFGQDGILTTVINVVPRNSQSNSVAVQSDGKILSAGYSYDGAVFHFTITRHNVNGSLDNSFGLNGIVITKIGSSNSLINSIAVQSDGKIIAAGFSLNSSGIPNIALVQYNSNGIVDTNFGSNGMVISDISGIGVRSVINSLVIQSDGKIIAGGYTSNGNDYDFAIVRYNPDGTPDDTFGPANGVVTTDISGSGLFDQINSVTIQKDGKIVAAGYTNDQNAFAVARYNSNGFLDNSFGTNGKVITAIGSNFDIAHSVVLQSDGKIVVGGFSNDGILNNYALVRYNSNGLHDELFGELGVVVTPIGAGFSEIWSLGMAPAEDGTEKILASGFSSNRRDQDFAIARYNATGTLDSTFGTSGTGIVSTPIGEANDQSYAAAIQNNLEDGSIDGIFLSGYSNIQGTDNFAIACFNADGNNDNNFGINGIVTTPIGYSDCRIYALALQPAQNDDEKIIAGGYTRKENATEFVLARYNLDGTIDTTFGTEGNGIVISAIGLLGSSNIITSIDIQNDGKIIAVGNSLIARYDQDGNIDNSFGINGIIELPFSIYNYSGNSIVVQNDEKFVVAGNYYDGMDSDFGVARYNKDGILDSTFGANGNGIIISPIGPSNEYVSSVAVQNDEKIIVSGSGYIGLDYDIIVVRYNDDGTLDDTFGVNGIVTSKIGDSEDYANSITQQFDGKIVLTAEYYVGNNSKFALLRYNNNGSVDSTFGTNGIVTESIDEKNGALWTTIQTNGGEDGKIVVAGSKFEINQDLFAFGRYNLDGSIDNTFGNNGIILSLIGTSHSFATSIVKQSNGKILAGGYSSIENGKYSVFTLARYNTEIIATGTEEENNSKKPVSFKLEQNYPNPFNPTTIIKYSIPFLETGHAPSVQLRVYDLLGREVATLVKKEQQPGNYEVEFNASNLSSGVYFYKLQAGNFIQTKKMLLLK